MKSCICFQAHMAYPILDPYYCGLVASYGSPMVGSLCLSLIFSMISASISSHIQYDTRFYGCGNSNLFCSSSSSLTSRKNGGDIRDDAPSSKKSSKSRPCFSRESTLDSSLANKFGGDAIKKPPFQSLHKVTKTHNVSTYSLPNLVYNISLLGWMNPCKIKQFQVKAKTIK